MSFEAFCKEIENVLNSGNSDITKLEEILVKYPNHNTTLLAITIEMKIKDPNNIDTEDLVSLINRANYLKIVSNDYANLCIKILDL